MNRFLWVCMALLVAFWTPSIGAYLYYYPTYTYHYRLTLEVEMPDGSVRSGSSVVAVSEWRNTPWNVSGEPNTVQDQMVGEATQVDLGDGRLLVALLLRRWLPTDVPGKRRPGWGETSPIRGSPTGVLARAYGLHGHGWGAERGNELLSRLSRQRGAREIGPDDLPDLVTFADTSDPRTIAAVDPRDLAASFGPGVKLRRAVVEVTDDCITEDQIEEWLPWLRGLEGRNLMSVQSVPGAPSTGLADSTGRLSFKIRAADGYFMLH